jgi:flagellin-specific chaperone FliS
MKIEKLDNSNIENTVEKINEIIDSLNKINEVLDKIADIAGEVGKNIGE